MELKRNGEVVNIHIQGPEVELIGVTYLEKHVRNCQRGTPNVTSDREKRWAGFAVEYAENEAKPTHAQASLSKSMTPAKSPVEVADDLDDFGLNTNDELVRIANGEPPAFRQFDIFTRERLGEAAIALAEQIRVAWAKLEEQEAAEAANQASGTDDGFAADVKRGLDMINAVEPERTVNFKNQNPDS